MQMPWMSTMVLAALGSLSSQTLATDVASKWVAEVSSPMLLEPIYARVALQKSGDTLSGSWGTDSFRGNVKGNSIDITLMDSGGHEAGAVTSLITGDSGTMTGLGRRGGGTAGDRPPVPQDIRWKFTRELVPPASPATDHL